VNRRDAQGVEKTFGDPMQGTAEWTVGYGIKNEVNGAHPALAEWPLQVQKQIQDHLYKQLQKRLPKKQAAATKPRSKLKASAGCSMIWSWCADFNEMENYCLTGLAER
jgi:hypothetical protein